MAIKGWRDPRERCAKCGATAKFRCSKCKEVGYCSKECQRSHWRPSHRSACVPLVDDVTAAIERGRRRLRAEYAVTDRDARCFVCLDSASASQGPVLRGGCGCRNGGSCAHARCFVAAAAAEYAKPRRDEAIASSWLRCGTCLQPWSGAVRFELDVERSRRFDPDGLARAIPPPPAATTVGGQPTKMTMSPDRYHDWHAAISGIASALSAAREYAASLRVSRRRLDLVLAVPGPSNPDAYLALLHIGDMHRLLQDNQSALELLRVVHEWAETDAAGRRLLNGGRDSASRVAAALLATADHDVRRMRAAPGDVSANVNGTVVARAKEAEALLRRNLGGRPGADAPPGGTAPPSSSSPATGSTHNAIRDLQSLAHAVLLQQRLDEAREVLGSALASARRVFGPSHSLTRSIERDVHECERLRTLQRASGQSA